MSGLPDEDTMLELFHAIAERAERARWIWRALAAGACVAFVVGVFTAPGTAPLLAALVVLLWSLLMLATARSFAQPAPVVDAGAGLLERLKARCWRGYLRVLALATTALAALVLYVSIRAVGLIARAAGG